MDLQFSTACLPRLPLRASFATARSLGLTGVELALTPTLQRRGPARVAALAARSGVRVRSIDLSLYARALELREVAAISAFVAALPECAVVVLAAPRAVGGTGGLGGYLELLRAYGERLQGRAVVTIANAADGAPGTPGPLGRFSQVRRVVEEWDLGYTFDTSHAASAGWVITEPLPQMGARLRNVHLGDFRRQLRPDSPSSTLLLPERVAPWQLHRAPGEGVLPLRAFLRALRQREYTGLVTLKLHEVGPRAWWPPALHGQLASAVLFYRAALDAYRPRHTDRPLGAIELENDRRRP